MNAPQQSAAFAADPAAETSALPIPRATLEEMERNRGRALDLFGQAFDILQEARRFAELATISGKTSDGDGGVAGGEFTDAARDALAPRYRFSGDNLDKRRAAFVDAQTKQTDQAMWSHIIKATDLERLMDKQARDDFRNELRENPPPATADNVRATLKAFIGDADSIFRRGIANAFSKLDRRFRSHDGFKIGARVILSYAFSDYGWNYHSRQNETLQDIERAFCVLEGIETPAYGAGIVGACEHMHREARYGRGGGFPVLVEGDHFRIRIFKNGNAHLWFERPDLVRKVNRILADHYGEAIGEGADVADVSDMGPGYHVTPARNFGLFETNEETAAKLFDRLPFTLEGKSVLEPSAGRGNLADLARRKGAARVQCVEVQHGLAAELRLKGHAVREGDFLKMSPADLGTFDVIVMNPPFDRGRDCDHVRHALQFLKPGGCLVAIMSAGTEFREDNRTASLRALLAKMDPADRWDRRGMFRDLPPGSFAHAGTNVNTITLAVRKPAA